MDGWMDGWMALYTEGSQLFGYQHLKKKYIILCFT